MPRRPRSALRSLPLLLGALLAAAPASAQEEVWTGSGETKSWNDAGNWASGRVPAPTIGLRLLFGAPEGAAFGFGGKAPLRFGQIHLATNSGPVVLQAPGIVLGGSVNGEPDVGFVLEDLSTPAVLRNEAPASLSLRGGVSLGYQHITNETIRLIEKNGKRFAGLAAKRRQRIRNGRNCPARLLVKRESIS